MPALDELAEIESDVLARFPGFAQVLASDRVPAAEKDRILTDVFEGRASSLVLRFLRVLNRHGRLGLLGPIIREARAIWDRRNRRIPVSVRSAVPLDESQMQALRDRLQGLVAGTPILTATIDPGADRRPGRPGRGPALRRVGEEPTRPASPSTDRREDA